MFQISIETFRIFEYSLHQSGNIWLNKRIKQHEIIIFSPYACKTEDLGNSSTTIESHDFAPSAVTQHTRNIRGKKPFVKDKAFINNVHSFFRQARQ